MKSPLTETKQFLVKDAEIKEEEEEDILNIEDEDVELLEDGSDEEAELDDVEGITEEEYYAETLNIVNRLQNAAENAPKTANPTKYVSELKLALDKEKMEMMRLMMLDITNLLHDIRDELVKGNQGVN